MENESYINELKRLAKEIINSMENYEGKEPDYILQNKNNEKDIYFIVSDTYDDKISLVNMYYPEKTESTPSWDFSFYDYLYKLLEEGYEIKWMDIGVHPMVWDDICNGYDEEDIESKGIQNYLKYCKNMKITRKMLQDECGNSMKVQDAMKYLKKEMKERER